MRLFNEEVFNSSLSPIYSSIYSHVLWQLLLYRRSLHTSSLITSELESYVEDEIAVKNDMYIAANGNVVTCCDFSYKRIDREAIGNVLNEPLSQIVSRYLKAEAA